MSSICVRILLDRSVGLFCGVAVPIVIVRVCCVLARL